MSRKQQFKPAMMTFFDTPHIVWAILYAINDDSLSVRHLVCYTGQHIESVLKMESNGTGVRITWPGILHTAGAKCFTPASQPAKAQVQARNYT